jgi:hypothetical protein
MLQKKWLKIYNTTRVINVTCHGGPSLYALEMIKHNQNILQITIRLHLLDYINIIGNIVNRHLKKEHLSIQLLFKKTIILNVIITILILDQNNVVTISFIGKKMLE